MAVPKRTRYEVLRRDNFSCRYCGASAPDVKLHVDHVTPVALGGSDDPSNLVAACADCNAGKSSVAPNAELVDDVRRDALRWAKAVTVAARLAAEAIEDRRAIIQAVRENAGYWNRPMAMPNNWEQTVLNYWDNGLDVSIINDAFDIAMAKKLEHEYDRYPYFCGVMRNKLKDITAAAQQMIERGDV